MAGKHQINSKKDGRMVWELNIRFDDNIRLGLETERSAFGKYNTKNTINASICHSF
ncbi:hypothetical protein OM280_22990 [Escherichia albertii]|nr:hypothetical protein [Escherichia albertii]